MFSFLSSFADSLKDAEDGIRASKEYLESEAEPADCDDVLNRFRSVKCYISSYFKLLHNISLTTLKVKTVFVLCKYSIGIQYTKLYIYISGLTLESSTKNNLRNTTMSREK